MPRTHHTRLARRIDAPIEVVWDVLSNHADYGAWTPVPSVTFRPAEGDQPNGIGAERVLGLAGVGPTERVVAFEPTAYLAYSIVGGAPVQDHLAEVRLNEDGDATAVTYQARFAASLPLTGTLTAVVMRGVLMTLLSRLAAESERRAA